MGMFDDLIPASKSGGMFDDLIPAPNAGRSRDFEGAPVGALEAAGRGATAGVTLNFGDELAGLWSASGIPQYLSNLAPAARQAAVGALLNTPFAPLVAGGPALAGGARIAAGDEGAARSYEETRDAVRAANKQAETDQPGAFLAGNVAGGIAVPIGGAAAGATRLARAGIGALTGAGVGAASGAGGGNTPAERVVGGAGGAALGGVIGGAAPPLIEGLVRAGGAAISTPANLIRAAINPTGTAERAVGRAYQEAHRADPGAINRLTTGEVQPGGTAVAMDVLGQPGRNLARSAANQSGEAKDILDQTLDPRFREQVPRFVNWFRTTLHYPDSHTQQTAMAQVQKSTNDRAYAAARQAGDHPIWSPEIERLTGAPEVVDAMRTAATKGKGRAIVEGHGGFNPGVTVSDDGIVTFQKGAGGVPTYPNLQFWDYTRRELSSAANKAQRAGDTEASSRIGGLAKLMNEELDKLVPAYGTARSGAAKFFDEDDAFKAGQKFVSENFNLGGTRQALSQMSPAERKLFEDGFVHRYIETLSKVSDRADVTKRIYNDPANRDKIRLVLGQQRADELEAMLRVENIMERNRGGVGGNSTTVMQLLGSGLAGATGGGYLGFDPTASGIATALATAGKKGIDQRVAVKVAQMLTSDDPAVLQRAVTAIARNQGLMNALRRADGATAKIGGQQGSQVPALQSAGIGRAEEQEP